MNNMLIVQIIPVLIFYIMINNNYNEKVEKIEKKTLIIQVEKTIILLCEMKSKRIKYI